MARGHRSLVLAVALGVMCRSYDVEHPDLDDTGGENTGGGHGGDSGDSGNEGALGGNGGVGGSSGAAGADGGGAGIDDRSGGGGNGGGGSGATGGSSGDGGAGESGGGGESGAGSGTSAEPGILGAVRLLVGGEPRCGGVLLTNDWVLTADQCVTSTDDPESLVIGFGVDAMNFQQTQRVIEIQRFPGNGGTDLSRGRDLLLLGVEHPFVIDGRTSGYHRPVWQQEPSHLLTPQRCIGWDLRVSTSSPTSRLHEEILAPFAFDVDVMNPSRPAGNRVWWLNTSHDPDQGVLPMPADAGSPCFHSHGDIVALSTIHSGNPELTRNQAENVGREAYSFALGEGEVHAWIRSVLFGSTETPIEVDGDVGGCASSRDRLEIFARRSGGSIGWWTWDGDWTARDLLPGPGPDAETFSYYLPGAYCTRAGGIELFAADLSGNIWWQRMDPDGNWSAAWQRVTVANTPVDSGIAVVGVLDDHFYVFARAFTGELRYAEFNAGWTRNWTNLGGRLRGTPSARMPQEGRIDVFALFQDDIPNQDNMPYQMSMVRGVWGDWIWNQQPVSASPAVVSWGHSHLEILTRAVHTPTLQLVWYEGTVWSPHIGTDVELPAGTPMAIARQPGTTDLFITQENKRIWHGSYPRKPSRNLPTPRTPEVSASTP